MALAQEVVRLPLAGVPPDSAGGLIWVGFAHVLPPYVRAFPFASTAAQKVAVGQETTLMPPRLGSADADDEVQVPPE